MNGTRSARLARNLIGISASSLVVGVGQSIAQSQPATIPIVVAQAMAFEPELMGRPQFFDGRPPPDWPAALVPPAAKVLGGGVTGNSAMYRMRVAVFEFSAQSDPPAVIKDLIARAGYMPPASDPPRSRGGGFAETAAPTPAGRYCNAGTLAMFGAVDSVRAPTVFAVFLLDGEAGRENCSGNRRESITQRFPLTVPPLSPPAGVVSIGNGSSWSGSSGEMRSTLRTTMPADSLLAHYSAKLVAGGWKIEGRAANVDGLGVQRFSVREGQDAWTGALIVIVAGDRRQVLLQVAKSE